MGDTLPTRVIKADGRIEPFDGDRISRSLYAAAVRLGRPDPFRARELTDGVLHFLAADGAPDPIPIGDLIDVIVKVVRELGQPMLARAVRESPAGEARDESRVAPVMLGSPD